MSGMPFIRQNVDSPLPGDSISASDTIMIEDDSCEHDFRYRY